MTPCIIRNASCGWKNLDDPKFHIEYDAYFTLPVHAFRHVSVAQSVYDDNSAAQCFPAHILLSHVALRLWMQVNDADRRWKKLHFRQSLMRAACSPTLGLTTATVCSHWQFNTDSPKWRNAFGNLRESYEELQRVPASFDKCFSTCSWGTFFFYLLFQLWDQRTDLRWSRRFCTQEDGNQPQQQEVSATAPSNHECNDISNQRRVTEIT